MIWAILTACADPTAEVLGTLTADGEAADVTFGTAFGYDADTSTGHGVVLVVAPKLDLSCDTVAGWLVDGDAPSGVVDAGTCVTTLASSADYDSAGTSASSTAAAPDYTFTASVWCAMDDAAWNDDGTYGGDVWLGSPTSQDVTVSGGGGGDFTWSLDGDGWDGGFPYDSARLDVAADGAVTGGGSATWCDGFADSAILQ